MSTTPTLLMGYDTLYLYRRAEADLGPVVGDELGPVGRGLERE